MAAAAAAAAAAISTAAAVVVAAAVAAAAAAAALTVALAPLALQNHRPLRLPPTFFHMNQTLTPL